ncbi:unnamed protein product [Mytilus edulis]|uniref:Endonuclease/exonuclease/phosphatase domain-containing protein n=1 Tax=Mytilus edulis TaxID=6550 RepID=A0A8S3V9R2_MYTED|nr:unnamed protein product [Mytilus edulis]
MELFELSHRFSKCLLVGDFNARTGSEDDFIFVPDSESHVVDIENIQINAVCNLDQYDFSRKRNSRDKNKNRFGNQLIEFCKGNNFFIMNGRTLGDIDGKFTCRNSSVVDYCLCSAELIKHFTDFKVLDFSSLYSDVHSPIEISLKQTDQEVSTKYSDDTRTNEQKIKNWTNEKSHKFLECLNLTEIENINSEIDGTTVVTQETVDTIIGKIGKVLINSARNTFGFKVSAGKKSEHRKNKPWFDHDCKATEVGVAQESIHFTRGSQPADKLHIRHIFIISGVINVLFPYVLTNTSKYQHTGGEEYKHNYVGDIQHTLVSIGDKKEKRCQFCRLSKCKTKAGWDILTRYKCKECEIPLCSGIQTPLTARNMKSTPGATPSGGHLPILTGTRKPCQYCLMNKFNTKRGWDIFSAYNYYHGQKKSRLWLNAPKHGGKSQSRPPYKILPKRTCTPQKALTPKRIRLLSSMKNSPASLSSNGNTAPRRPADDDTSILDYFKTAIQNLEKKINLAADFLTFIQMVNLIGGPKVLNILQKAYVSAEWPTLKTKK